MATANEGGFDSDNAELDEVFERYGPLDVEAFIDAQFKHALGDEGSIGSSNHGEAQTVTRKMEVVDGPAQTAATLHPIEFSFGGETLINLDPPIPSSPQDEEQSSSVICSRCRENTVEGMDLESCRATSKTTTTREAQVEKTKGCDSGIELKDKETTMDPRDAVVTELQLADISDDVGTCWRELGPKLKIAGSKIHNLDEEYRSNRDKASALLIIWKQQEGRGATVGRLADHLMSIGRKSIAEKLLVSQDEVISLTVKCSLNAELDSKLMLCEDTDGNKFILKRINNSERHWNSEEIQKNKQFLEAVAAAAWDFGKTADQRRQESLKRISSEVQELRQQLKRVKLDCGDTESHGSGISYPKENTQPVKEPQGDVKVTQQDAEHLLQSCEEQHSLCQAIYHALIKLIGEVGQPRDDNFMCIKQLCDFTKELKDQERTFFPKIEMLHSRKKHLDEQQVAQVEKLEKWSRAQTEQVEGVEKLLLSLLSQGKIIERNQKLLKRRSEPVLGVKPSSGFGRRRCKTDSSKNSNKSQSLSELSDVNRKCNISGPLCVQKMCPVDTDKKLMNGQKHSSAK